MINFSDEIGNEVVVNDKGKILLQLKSENRIRDIGTINTEKGIYSKYTSEVFRKLNAFGFNDKVIHVLNPSWVIVYYLGERYCISREEFEKNKSFLFFKAQGFEKQCFVPVDKFRIGGRIGKGDGLENR